MPLAGGNARRPADCSFARSPSALSHPPAATRRRRPTAARRRQRFRPCAAEPNDYASGMITKEEVEARGSGTNEARDTYDASRRGRCELRVLFTGARLEWQQA